MLSVRVSPGTARVEVDQVGPDHAELRLQTIDGSVALDRRAGTVTFSLPEAIDHGALAHPFLASSALVAAYWQGRESFHAGVFVAGGRAWAVLGDKGDGKSTLMAWMAARGVPVLSDDVLVVDDGVALAGPRSVDLRAESSRRLDLGVPLGVVGARERWRVKLDAVPPAVPLGGWVLLRWADGPPVVEPIRGAARLAALAPHRGVRLPPVRDGAPLLALSALPMLELRRPRDWGSLDDAGERLLAATA